MTSSQMVPLAIFCFTYLFIAFQRIPYFHMDRAGGVLIGAVLMVLSGSLTFDQAWGAIDPDTIVLLLGMMIINGYLEESGFFDLTARLILAAARTPTQLLAGLAILSGVLSALFLNDTICIMFTPPLLGIVTRLRQPAVPYLITLAMSANIGSVMTVVGNPQNMLIHSFSGWTYGEFALRMIPVGLVGLLLLIGILKLFYRRELRSDAFADAAADLEAAKANAKPVDKRLLAICLGVLVLVLIGFTQNPKLSIVAITGGALLMVLIPLSPRKMLGQVDWILLMFFGGLFIVVEAVAKSGLVELLLSYVQPYFGETSATQIPVFCTLTVLASNVVSNVPFVMLVRDLVPKLAEPQLMWLMLAMASTFAGNLTIPGSVATLIVIENAGEKHAFSFWEFLRVGFVVTLVTTAVGAMMLVGIHQILPEGTL